MNRRRYGLVLAWVATLALAVSLFDSWGWVMLLRTWRGVAWGVAPFIGMVIFALGGRGWWRFSCGWGLLGGVVWVCVGYARDSNWLFYGAIAFLLAALVTARCFFVAGFVFKQAVNTIILLMAALPVFDFVFDKNFAVRSPVFTSESAGRYYSFEATHGDPGVFAAWWNYWWGEMNRFLGDVSEPAPGFRPPIRLRPHAMATLMDCSITINGEGFRGREIASEKGETYRIVALGESTTFGMTMHQGDKPWPELLEAMIRERLKLSRPVEVINAGTPGYDLADNLRRLAPDILPLRPDLIISYHGYNGFPMLDKSFPHLVGAPPPAFPERPLQLAAAIEYRLRLHEMLEGQMRLAAEVPEEVTPRHTPYAAAYEGLIRFAQTNHIGLALANFCMAIDQGSDQRAVRFYGSCGWGEVCVRHRANAIHSEIVRELAAAHPEVLFVDAQPEINAHPEMFVDVVHLTEEGNQKLAENIFGAIRPALEKDLAEAGFNRK